MTNQPERNFVKQTAKENNVTNILLGGLQSEERTFIISGTGDEICEPLDLNPVQL